MCGIAGIIDLNGHRTPDVGAVGRMLTTIAHRGPDGSRVVSSAGMAIGAVRLAIVDRQGGHQPFQIPELGITVAFNGEIDNYLELREELVATGARFTTDSDTEVVARSFAEWGPSFHEHFRGMYAVAIYRDQPRTFLLRRSPYGEKPLYVAHLPDGWLAFASEANALIGIEGRKSIINMKVASQVLALGFPLAPETFFSSITQLDAGEGHAFELEQDGAVEPPQGGVCKGTPALNLRATHPASTIEPLAHDSPPRAHEGRVQLHGAALLDELHERLRIAIGRCLKPGVPAGIFLSGGIDSAIIAGIANEIVGDSIPTFSVAFSDARFDESAHAVAVARHLGLRHHVIRIDTITPEDVRRVCLSHGEPFADPSSLALRKLCEFASPHLRIALGGDGGDELFGGYDRQRAYTLIRALHTRLPARVAHGIAALLATLMRVFAGDSRSQRMERCSSAFARHDRAPYMELLAISDEQDRERLLNDKFKPFARLAAAAARPDDEPRPLPISRLSAFDESRQYEASTYLPNDLCSKSDRQSMALGIELRSPFLDRGVVDFAMGVGGDQHVSSFTSKKLLRQLASRYMPDELWTRPKMGFGVPIACWLRGPLRSMTESLRDSDVLVNEAHLSRDAIVDLVNDHLSERRDVSRLLYALITIDLALSPRS